MSSGRSEEESLHQRCLNLLNEIKTEFTKSTPDFKGIFFKYGKILDNLERAHIEDDAEDEDDIESMKDLFAIKRTEYFKLRHEVAHQIDNTKTLFDKTPGFFELNRFCALWISAIEGNIDKFIPTLQSLLHFHFVKVKTQLVVDDFNRVILEKMAIFSLNLLGVYSKNEDNLDEKYLSSIATHKNEPSTVKFLEDMRKWMDDIKLLVNKSANQSNPFSAKKEEVNITKAAVAEAEKHAHELMQSEEDKEKRKTRLAKKKEKAKTKKKQKLETAKEKEREEQEKRDKEKEEQARLALAFKQQQENAKRQKRAEEEKIRLEEKAQLREALMALEEEESRRVSEVERMRLEDAIKKKEDLEKHRELEQTVRKKEVDEPKKSLEEKKSEDADHVGLVIPTNFLAEKNILSSEILGTVDSLKTFVTSLDSRGSLEIYGSFVVHVAALSWGVTLAKKPADLDFMINLQDMSFAPDNQTLVSFFIQNGFTLEMLGNPRLPYCKFEQMAPRSGHGEYPMSITVAFKGYSSANPIHLTSHRLRLNEQSAFELDVGDAEKQVKMRKELVTGKPELDEIALPKNINSLEPSLNLINFYSRLLKFQEDYKADFNFDSMKYVMDVAWITQYFNVRLNSDDWYNKMHVKRTLRLESLSLRDNAYYDMANLIARNYFCRAETKPIIKGFLQAFCNNHFLAEIANRDDALEYFVLQLQEVFAKYPKESKLKSEMIRDFYDQLILISGEILKVKDTSDLSEKMIAVPSAIVQRESFKKKEVAPSKAGKLIPK